MVGMGIGEIGIGDEVLLTPSISLAHSTYTDPVRDYGNDMKVFDVDVQVGSLALPFVLPNDFTLSLAYAYTRPISFRNDNVISYSNTPQLNIRQELRIE